MQAKKKAPRMDGNNACKAPSELKRRTMNHAYDACLQAKKRSNIEVSELAWKKPSNSFGQLLSKPWSKFPKQTHANCKLQQIKSVSSDVCVWVSEWWMSEWVSEWVNEWVSVCGMYVGCVYEICMSKWCACEWVMCVCVMCVCVNEWCEYDVSKWCVCVSERYVCEWCVCKWCVCGHAGGGGRRRRRRRSGYSTKNKKPMSMWGKICSGIVQVNGFMCLKTSCCGRMCSNKETNILRQYQTLQTHFDWIAFQRSVCLRAYSYLYRFQSQVLY